MELGKYAFHIYVSYGLTSSILLAFLLVSIIKQRRIRLKIRKLGEK